jgi:hypothetical protein
MSGAPVVMRAKTHYIAESGEIKTQINATRWLGIYASRPALPAAIPLIDEDRRAEVGFLYKMGCVHDAIVKGVRGLPYGVIAESVPNHTPIRTWWSGRSRRCRACYRRKPSSSSPRGCRPLSKARDEAAGKVTSDRSRSLCLPIRRRVAARIAHQLAIQKNFSSTALPHVPANMAGVAGRGHGNRSLGPDALSLS